MYRLRRVVDTDSFIILIASLSLYYSRMYDQMLITITREEVVELTHPLAEDDQIDSLSKCWWWYSSVPSLGRCSMFCQKRHMMSPKSPAVEVQPKLDTEINENK